MVDERPIQNFIFEVLDQIRGGVSKAQSKSHSSGFTVNPGGLVLKDESGVLSITHDGYICGKVEFDLSVTVEEVAEAQGGFKLSLFGGGFSVGGKYNDKSGSIHKVKFFVPVEYPREAKRFNND